jgi:hypothetical protein
MKIETKTILTLMKSGYSRNIIIKLLPLFSQEEMLLINTFFREKSSCLLTILDVKYQEYTNKKFITYDEAS